MDGFSGLGNKFRGSRKGGSPFETGIGFGRKSHSKGGRIVGMEFSLGVGSGNFSRIAVFCQSHFFVQVTHREVVKFIQH